MLKKAVIVVLLVLVLGLYFFTDETKEAMTITGKAIKENTEKAVDEVRENSEVDELVESVNLTNESSEDG
ncbi:MAG: hypothetical protein ACQEP1_06695 [Nanobdellota archaeon]